MRSKAPAETGREVQSGHGSIPSDNGSLRSKSPLQFFLLVFALSIPFWVLGAVTGAQLLPGLPVAALMFVCPLLAALILVYREDKNSGVAMLLAKSFDFKRIKPRIWYAPIVLLMPAMTALTYGVMKWLGSSPPTPHLSALTAPMMAIAFFVAGLSEELGWSGYAIDPMQKTWTAIQASLALGVIWAIWHVIPLIEAHRPAAWIAWWCLGTIALRVLMVWLYNNTHASVFAAALFHAMINICWVLAPAYYDPRITSLALTFLAATVTAIWGPRTLARWKLPIDRQRMAG